jgi:hypothetical protein
MTDVNQTTPAPIPAEEPHADLENPGVARCMNAYICAQEAAMANGKGSVSCEFAAEKAYRKAMPRLSGEDNIRDFIACVAQGMLIGAIAGPDGARLLYAAQVDHTTVNNKGLTRKSASK